MYGKIAKLFYTDTDSFIVYIKTNYIYEDIGEDAGSRFDASKYKFDRPFPKKNEKSN